MGEERVETGVDDLLAYLKGKGKISVKDVAKAIHVSEKTLQLWVDFLVEERVLGLEYKFMNPYIFLNEVEKKKSEVKEITIDNFRRSFFENARKKSIPEDKIQSLWEHHLRTHLDHLKQFFIIEAKKQNFKNANPEELFENYKTKILTPKEELKELKEEQSEEKQKSENKNTTSTKDNNSQTKQNFSNNKISNSTMNKTSRDSRGGI